MPSKEQLSVGSNLPIIGGTLAAVGAGLCCVGPFVLLSLGISGAWIGNLTLLEPYRPLFIVAVVGLFGWAGWKVHQPVKSCQPGTACAAPNVRKRRQKVFWLAVSLALLLTTSPYWLLFVA